MFWFYVSRLNIITTIFPLDCCTANLTFEVTKNFYLGNCLVVPFICFAFYLNYFGVVLLQVFQFRNYVLLRFIFLANLLNDFVLFLFVCIFFCNCLLYTSPSPR